MKKKRLDELGRTDIANKISWVSQDSDSYGYDIESFDIDDEGKEYPIKIEVKTTTAEDGPFYLSHNELVTLKNMATIIGFIAFMILKSHLKSINLWVI